MTFGEFGFWLVGWAAIFAATSLVVVSLYYNSLRIFEWLETAWIRFLNRHRS